MKKNYIAPEAKLLGFAPAEHLANDMDDLLGETLTENQVSGVTVDPNGFDIDLDL